MHHAYAADMSSRDAVGKAAAYDLDLRKFRH
jgi:hypothetical protein